MMQTGRLFPHPSHFEREEPSGGEQEPHGVVLDPTHLTTSSLEGRAKASTRVAILGRMSLGDDDYEGQD
jgi:hypothetical protein